MKLTISIFRSTLLTVSVLLCALTASHAQKGGEGLGMQYQFPSNAATGITRQTTVIIRPGDILNPATIKPTLITVKGAISGTHMGAFTLSDDRRTMIFKPATLFTYSERVTVTLRKGVLTLAGKKADSLYFYFTIQSAPKGKAPTTTLSESQSSSWKYVLEGESIPENNSPQVQSGDPFPDFPTLRVSKMDNPAPGNIFLGTFDPSTNANYNLSYLAILNDSGAPKFLRGSGSKMMDLKVNSNGLLTYYDANRLMFFAMDSNYTIVDSFQCGLGYFADVHDIELLPNGHALLMACDTEKDVDISQWIPGAPQSANVIGVVLQEIDSRKDVIFNWRSLDSGHYKITDMIEDPFNYLEANIDAVHANSLQIDVDGNILLSARHLDEVTKISLDSGKILWRFGGKNNQFALEGDSIWFSHQHAVRRIANGHITMFDNGNDHRFHDPPAPWYSRACEYVLDEKAKTATLVWQFDDGRRDSSGFMGNVQRLDNGNTFISWGGVNMHSSYGPAITEVDSTGAIKFELYMQAPYLTYRAYRYEWNVPARLEGVTPHYQSDIPAAPTLSDAYPNPAVSSSNIAIGLPQEMVADLRIYDALGHEAARLASGLLSQGPHTFSFDGSKLSAGVYHCILQAGGKTLATQIVLSK